jgi:IS5 family transposase
VGLNLTNKRTRKHEFPDEMDRVDLIKPHAPDGKRGRSPFGVQTMRQIHFMQQWFNLSEGAMEDVLHDIALFREFAGLSLDRALSGETTILRFRRLIEQHKLAPRILGVVNDLLRDKGLMLRRGTVVDARLIAAPGSTKNASGECDPQIMQVKKGNQRCFGMKACICVDAKLGLVHSVQGTAGSTNDVVQANSPLHGVETEVWSDTGFIRAPRNGLMPEKECDGTSRCDRASADKWTKAKRLTY